MKRWCIPRANYLINFVKTACDLRGLTQVKVFY